MSLFCSKCSTPHPPPSLAVPPPQPSSWFIISKKKVITVAFNAEDDPHKGLHSPTPLPYGSHLIFYHSPFTLCITATLVSLSSLCLKHLPPKQGWHTSFRYLQNFFRSFLWSPYLKAYVPIILILISCPFFILFFIDISLYHQKFHENKDFDLFNDVPSLPKESRKTGAQ